MVFPVTGPALALLAAATVAWASRPTPVLWGSEQLVPYSGKSSILAIAERHGASPEAIRRLNRLGAGKRSRTATMLYVSTRSIAPRPFRDGIVINLPSFRLFLLRGGEVHRSWPVALGRDIDREWKDQTRWRTPVGTFKILAKYWHADWIVPRDLRKELKKPRRVVPYGDPEYPLGEAKLQLTTSGLTIHGTNSPRSIGRLASHGCIRVWNSAIKELYKEVKVGTPVALVYAPVQVVESGGRIWLEVSRDIYGLAGDLRERTRIVLQGAGLQDRVDPEKVARAVEAAPGVAIDVTATIPAPGAGPPTSPGPASEANRERSPRTGPDSNAKSNSEFHPGPRFEQGPLATGASGSPALRLPPLDPPAP